MDKGSKRRLNWLSASIGFLAAALLLASAPVIADVGDAVLQGRANRVDALTTLRGAAEPSNLRLINELPDQPGLAVFTEPGTPPFKVNRKAKVTNLNADLLDGRSLGALMLKSVYDSNRDGSADSSEVAATLDGVGLVDVLPGGTLPAGATVRGVFGIAGAQGNFIAHGVDFGYTLPAAPVPHYIESGGSAAECPGSASAPEAMPGHLCIYETVRNGVVDGGMDIVTGHGALGVNTFGFMVAAEPHEVTGSPLVYGSWAVTAGPAPGAVHEDVSEGIYGR